MTALDAAQTDVAARVTTEVETGLVYVELSHVFGHYQPVYPGFKDLVIRRVATHAMHGVLTSHLCSVMHHGTHVNAPIHMSQRGAGVGELPLDRFFGNGVVLSIPKGEWEYVEPADLEAAAPAVEPGDIVVINTGWHANYADSMEYFGHAPGLSAAAAQWLIERAVTMVAVDTATVDHPLATSLSQSHRGFPPVVVELPRRYRKRTGHEVHDDFPAWNPAHKLLAAAGIPTIENVGGDVDAVTSTRATFHAMPWYWPQGDACIIRFVAILDPSGDYRFGEWPLMPTTAANGLQFYNLSHEIGHNMPQWPSPFSPPLVTNRLQYHAMHDCYTVEYDGILHRGTHMDSPIHVESNTPYLGDFDLSRFFGTGVAVSIPKAKWEVITPADLENAQPRIEPGDIVMINTGAHHLYGDNDDYYSYSPGLYTDAAQWLVDRRVKLVGVDVQALDHPLGTRMVEHGPGPILPHLIDEYRAHTGREVADDFPDWEPAHRVLLTNGVPGIENVGGELDAVTGKRCTFLAFPVRIDQGGGSPIRVVAVIDPNQTFRIPTGLVA